MVGAAPARPPAGCRFLRCLGEGYGPLVRDGLLATPANHENVGTDAAYSGALGRSLGLGVMVSAHIGAGCWFLYQLKVAGRTNRAITVCHYVMRCNSDCNSVYIVCFFGQSLQIHRPLGTFHPLLRSRFPLAAVYIRMQMVTSGCQTFDAP